MELPCPLAFFNPLSTLPQILAFSLLGSPFLVSDSKGHALASSSSGLGLGGGGFPRKDE